MLDKLWRSRSIRAKLTIIVTAACLAALLVAGLTFVAYDRLDFKRNMVADMEVLADILGSNSTAAVVFDNRQDALDVLAGLRAEEHVIAAAIFRADRELFADYHREGQPAAAEVFPPEKFGYQFHQDYLTIHREIHLENERIGSIWLKVDLEELATRFGRFTTAVIVVTVISLLLALIVITQLQRVVSKPIRQLSSIADHVSRSKDYSIRATVHGNDEVGFLVQMFNGMLQQIQKRDHKLQKINNELEDRVKHRTRELETEIADRKLAELTLRNSERRFRSLIENGSDVITIISDNGIIQYNSPSVERVLGYDPEELSGEYFLDKIYSDDVEATAAKFAEVLAKPSVAFSLECRYLNKSGDWRFLEASAVNLLEDPAVAGIVINSRDITDRKHAEERLRASLHEKEILLKEIHHRVKNNLQVITSLLNLQSRGIKNEKSLAMFRDSQARVKSMALIHEKLYQSDDLARIDFADYVRSLVNYLSQSFRDSIARVNITHTIDSVHLAVDLAVPCGLIINELVSNSLKHAFAEDGIGNIRIEFNQLTEDQLLLRVSDDGKGLPSELDFRNTQSLGLQLVNTLTGQLGGTIDATSENGTCFTITFCQSKKEKGVGAGTAVGLPATSR